MGRISSNILVSNSFRIFGKSKTLILTLGSLLSVGTIITSTIINSTYLMSESKNHIIQNGNPSDLTITIPKDQLSSDANNDQDDISNGKTLADLKLQTFLTSNNFNYTFSKNLSMSDITTGNNFLLSLANSDNSLNTGAVNKLLIDSGNPIPNSTLSNDNQIIINAEPYFYNLRQIKRFPNDKNLIDSTLKLFEYQNYLNAKPWVLAKILSNSQ
ncbi:hypothetical protein IKD56_05240 [bacterium]|nr:hypothetical protein [bacterium]